MNTLIHVATFAGAVTVAHGQTVLSGSQVPFIGGNVFPRNASELANYTFSYKPPFDPSVYGGYYTWAVDNNTVSAANFTGYDTAQGYTIPDGSYVMNPYFSVNEGHPKVIDNTTLFPQGGNCVKKILHIMFENEVFNWTMSDPYWQLMATRGKLLTNSHGITHPSLPNYAAVVAGDFFGIAHEDFYNVNATTVYDLLDAKSIDYTTYVEWYSPIPTHRGPKDCNNYIFNGPIDNTNPVWYAQVYRRLDIPALLFSSYPSNYQRCSKVYNATEKFAGDVNSHNLPPYSFYITRPAIGSIPSWNLYLPELEKQGTLVVASFDEATWTNDSDSVPNNDNRVVTMLFGAGVTPNTTSDNYITHYGLLRGAIENFQLGSLGRNDTNATNGNLYDMVNCAAARSNVSSTGSATPAAYTSSASIRSIGSVVALAAVALVGFVLV